MDSCNVYESTLIVYMFLTVGFVIGTFLVAKKIKSLKREIEELRKSK